MDYKKPILILISINCNDVITTSQPGDNDNIGAGDSSWEGWGEIIG